MAASLRWCGAAVLSLSVPLAPTCRLVPDPATFPESQLSVPLAKVPTPVTLPPARLAVAPDATLNEPAKTVSLLRLIWPLPAAKLLPLLKVL